MLDMTDLAVLSIEHDKAETTGWGTAYTDLFSFIDSGVSRRAYRCSVDGNVYKVGDILVNYDEYLANKWFAKNFSTISPELADRVEFPRIDCFRFAGGRSVNVMPFVEHNPEYEVVTIREFAARGFYGYCYVHMTDGQCDCPRNISPKWWMDVSNIFSHMGCMDFDIGRNAFVPDGQHIVPIDLGYWGLCAGWQISSHREKAPWQK